MKKTIFIFLIISFALFATACESVQNQIKEETVEKVVGKILGENVDVTITSPTPDANEPDSTATNGIFEDIISNGKDSEITWPENIPSIVPRFEHDIQSKINTPNGVILDFGETEIELVEQYVYRLEEYLYETIREEISEKKFDASYRKDETLVNVYWYKNGIFSLLITWD